MPFKPAYPKEIPTLGYTALQWMEDNLLSPGKIDGRGYIPTLEQVQFTLNLYKLNPRTCKRVINRAVICRPRGWGKSPFLAALLLFEALGPCIPEGWDAAGRPVGMERLWIDTPMMGVAAATVEQCENAWRPLMEMLDGAPAVENYPGLYPMETFIALPGRGQIKKMTSSARSAKGRRQDVIIADQTESWGPPSGHDFYNTLRANVSKSESHGLMIEAPNAFYPGMESQAEKTYVAYQQIVTGRSRLKDGILWDHREAPADTDLTDKASLEHGLRVAYGCSSNLPCVLEGHRHPRGWANIQARLERIWEPDSDPQLSRSDYLNQITHAQGAWISQPQWSSCKVDDDYDRVKPGQMIVLGFDGSRGRAHGKPDASALIGVRLTDGLMFEVWTDEAPDEPHTWQDWQPDIATLEAVLADTFRRYQVMAFYADPGKDWRSHVNAWENRYGNQVKKKASANHPFEWWMTGGRNTLVEKAVMSMEGAIVNGDLKHRGEATLTRHILHCFRRISNGKLSLGKRDAKSMLKIDAAIAGVLAWQAYSDALATGVLEEVRGRSTTFERIGGRPTTLSVNSRHRNVKQPDGEKPQRTAVKRFGKIGAAHG